MPVDLTAIILTYNEEIHIKRCLENVQKIAKNIFIIDSYSTDRTLEIAKGFGVNILQHKWENNHAKQFNWALDNCPINTKWVLRLDADEYLTDELIKELKEILPNVDNSINGIILTLKRFFLGKHIKRGVGEITQMRLFKYGKARCELRQMDEHIQLLEGDYLKFKGAWVDDNLNDIGWWIQKHNGYAIREAIDLLDIEFGLTDYKISKTNDSKLTLETSKKRVAKHHYVHLPLFWRSFAYFIYRYFLKFGFLDGKEGFLWHFLQGWWYRTLVDVKVWEIKKHCGNDVNKIKEYLRVNHSIQI